MADGPVTARFLIQPEPSGTEFRLEVAGLIVPHNVWAIEAPSSLVAGVAVLQRLIASEQAVTDGDTVLVEHAAIAALSAAEAASLQLPALSAAVARVGTQGLITQPQFRATLQWCRPGGQAIVAPQRIGAWLRVGGALGRLSAPLFAIAEAVEKVAAVTEQSEKLSALAQLREVLPDALTNGSAMGGGLAASIAIVQAEAFSLDLLEDGTSSRLIPILHESGTTDRLLSDELQNAFADEQFNQFGEARSLYTLPGGVYLALPPTLRKALQVVREQQSASRSRKRAFLAAPRRFLREAFDSDDDPTLVDAVESIFTETPAYSDRVLALGLWVPRVVPWLSRPSTDWFGPEGQEAAAGGLEIEGERISLKPEQARALALKIEAAMQRGEEVVSWQAPDGVSRPLPATLEMSQQLEAIARAQEPTGPATVVDRPPPPQRLSIIIKPNEESLEYEDEFVQREALNEVLPSTLLTPLKAHQQEGVRWLMRTWLAGRPGVLLADDMGLGKTLQGLVFLAWLRDAMEAGRLPQQPLLIVAPTGLLANWVAEHGRHFRSPGLGRLLPAYGTGLRSLRIQGEDGSPKLDRARLAQADWVMTTYETLRDYDTEFGTVHFAAMLMDEAQKVKTPAARMTDAAKGMHADFKVAMTGTPVENRLADLWCIVDGVHSGYLRDLKHFSAAYEAPGAEPQRMKQLKARLERPFAGAPGLMLRRLRKDRLPDLPEATTHQAEADMPPVQADAYRRIVAEARGETKKGARLAALQRLRAVCLHPCPDQEADDDKFIAASARLNECFRALRIAHDAQEAALVFVEDLDMQARLAGIIQRRFGLASSPDIISGEVSGARRQARVDQFQAGGGFGVMLISPKAGGVGLTLTRANHVIHLTRWWNPAVEDQCTGRALRIGQIRPVHIHLPMGRLPGHDRAFDHNLHDLLERKRQLMHDALVPPVSEEADESALFEATMGLSA